MTAPNVTACAPWADEAALDTFTSCGEDSNAADWLEVATDLLFHLSGLQYPGECTTTVRPCGSRRTVARWRSLGDLALGMPAWAGWGCSCGEGACGCSGGTGALLGLDPIRSVDAVKVDGVELDEGAYRVDDWRLLVRLDGEAWPCCQDLTLPDDSEGTWSVTVKHGAPPPPAGVAACAALACELAKAAKPNDGDSTCDLPPEVVSLVREGVSVQIRPDTFTDGRTGVELADRFLDAVNPNRLQRRGQVIDPGRVRRSRNTNT